MYITTKLNQQSNFRFSLLHVFFYKKKLRNKTQLKKEHTILGYWPGILQKSNAQSILGQCGAHIEVEAVSPCRTCADKGHCFSDPAPPSRTHLCSTLSRSHVGWLRQTSSRDKVLKTHASDLKNITKQKPFREHGCVYEKGNPLDFSSKCSLKGVEQSCI